MNTHRPWTAYLFLVAGAALGFGTVVAINGGVRTAPAMAQQRTLATTVGAKRTEDVGSLRALNDTSVNLAEFVKPAVVHIKTVTERATDKDGKRIPISGSEGSGFVYRSDGYILTNDHVVNGAKEVTVIFNDGREVSGKVTSAPEWDVAVVKVDQKDLETLAMADSKEVKVGQMTMATGSPYGLENSVTFGHVSALGRENAIPDGMDYRFYPDLIQTDAAINQGNSGGPLVDIDGRVIGMISSIFSRNGGSNGIGFAIPSNQVKLLADLLIKDGKVDRAMIGVVPRNLKPIEKKDLGLTGGAMVESVEPGSSADKAGLKKGDIITRIGSEEITSQIDLRNSMLTNKAGSTVKITFQRGKESKSADVKLSEFKVERKLPQGQQDGQRLSPDELGDLFGNGKMPNIDDLRRRFKDLDGNGDKKIEPDVAPLSEGKPRLGVGIEALNDENRAQFTVPKDVKGVLITSIEPGSVAARIGLKVGDVILKLGSKDVSTPNELIEQVSTYKLGDVVKIKIGHYTKGTQAIVEQTITFK